MNFLYEFLYENSLTGHFSLCEFLYKNSLIGHFSVLVYPKSSVFSWILIWSHDARPDQEEMEQAINKILQLLPRRLEKQEKKHLATLLSQLPKPAVAPAQGSARWASLHVCGRGFWGWFSPNTGRRSGRYVTPRKLRLYLHAQDNTRDILGYPSLFSDILVLSTRLFLTCCCSKIAPYDRMNRNERYFFGVRWQCSLSKWYSYR